MGRISGRANACDARSRKTKTPGERRPALHCFEINLLAGLLGEGSSDVGIFLHHESSIGGTQVEDQAAGYAIDGHGDPAVRTDLIRTAGWESADGLPMPVVGSKEFAAWFQLKPPLVGLKSPTRSLKATSKPSITKAAWLVRAVKGAPCCWEKVPSSTASVLLARK